MTRAAILVLGSLGILLAFTLENQNIAYMATLAFASIYLVSRFDHSDRAIRDRAGFEEQHKVAFGPH